MTEKERSEPSDMIGKGFSARDVLKSDQHALPRHRGSSALRECGPDGAADAGAPNSFGGRQSGTMSASDRSAAEPGGTIRFPNSVSE
jgi:hypothetical protein